MCSAAITRGWMEFFWRLGLDRERGPQRVKGGDTFTDPPTAAGSWHTWGWQNRTKRPSPSVGSPPTVTSTWWHRSRNGQPSDDLWSKKQSKRNDLKCTRPAHGGDFHPTLLWVTRPKLGRNVQTVWVLLVFHSHKKPGGPAEGVTLWWEASLCLPLI